MSIAKYFSRDYVDRRVEEIRAEGYADGFAKGYAKGFAKGYAKAQRLWQDWNGRRMAAVSEGRVFDEPPPA